MHIGRSVCVAWGPHVTLFPSTTCVLQVLRYFDYVFTGVFTFEMVIKVNTSGENVGCRVWTGPLRRLL